METNYFNNNYIIGINIDIIIIIIIL